MPIFMTIKPSTNKNKKFMAIFSKDIKGKRQVIKITHFGQKGADDYTITGDKEQRKRYRSRHKRDLEKGNYMSAGYLSMFLLWGESKSLQTNINAYKKKFNLK